FASRRRHTRSKRDWSSDVCSSDLRPGRHPVSPGGTRALITENDAAEVVRLAEVASAVVSLMPSFRGGKGAIAKELGGPLKGAGRDGGKTFGGGTKAGIAGMASRIFAPLAAAAGAVAIGGFFKDAIRAAGDLEQSVGAVDAVFRTSADQVLKWGKGAATSVGLSTDAYNQSAAVVGAMLTNYGVANDKVESST